MAWKGDWKGAQKSGREGRYARGAGPYDGQWKQTEKASYRHGIGTQLWDCGSLIGCMYEGEWRDGKSNGQGKFTFVDGSLFECEWRDGVMNGKATCILADGSTFKGMFQEGRPNGPGVWRNELEKLEANFIQGVPKEGEITGVDGTATSLDDGLREKWRFRFVYDLADAERRQLHRPNPILNPVEWRANRVRELSGLPPAHVNRLCIIYGVNIGNHEDGEAALSFTQICNGLAKAMWDRVPSSELISHARDQLATSEMNPLIEQDKMEAKFEAFMDEIIEEDEELHDDGVMAWSTRAESVTRESLASSQNPQYLGYILLGHACAINAAKGSRGGLHLDLTAPPSRPGDLAYCATPSVEMPGAHVRNEVSDAAPSHPLYSKRVAQRQYPSFGQVQRYTGHCLRNVSVGEVPKQSGAPKAVPPLNSHDLSMNSHVPTFQGETGNQEGLLRAKIGYREWHERKLALVQSRHISSPPSHLPPAFGSSFSKQHLSSKSRLSTPESVSLPPVNSAMSSPPGAIQSRVKTQDNTLPVGSPGQSVHFASKLSTGEISGRSPVRARISASFQMDEALVTNHEPVNMDSQYDMTILGELVYKDADRRPLVEWQSINDALGGILKPYYGEEAEFTTAKPPYSQGPATMPPNRPKQIATAVQLVFTLGLKENNPVLPLVRSLNISGHALPSLPDRIASMSQLEVFKLSHNNLSCLPDSFIVFTKLKSLKLSNNPNLGPELPHQILKLTLLEELYLCNTGLSTLTSSIEALSLLQKLDVSLNVLSSLPLLSLTNMKQLLFMDAAGNPILPGDTICGLPKEIVQQRGSTSFVVLEKKEAPPRMSAYGFAAKKRQASSKQGYWVPIGILGYLRQTVRCFQPTGMWEEVREYKGDDPIIKTLSDLVRMARFLPAEHYQFVLKNTTRLTRPASDSLAEFESHEEEGPAQIRQPDYNPKLRYVDVSSRLQHLFHIMSPNAKENPDEGVTCGLLLRSLNGTNLVRTRLENILAYVEQFREYSNLPDATLENNERAADHISVNSMIKSKSMKDTVKVENMADYWGGGSMYNMDINCFQSVMCILLIDLQARGHLQGEQEKKKSKKKKGGKG